MLLTRRAPLLAVVQIMAQLLATLDQLLVPILVTPLAGLTRFADRSLLTRRDAPDGLLGVPLLVCIPNLHRDDLLLP